MADRRDSPAAPAPATPAREQLTPAEKVMLGALIALVGGLFVSMVSFHRQIGDLRAEIHQEFGALRTDLERQINDLRTDLGQRIGDIEERIGDVEERMARLEAIMVAHLGTPPLPADGAGDGAPAQ